MRVRRYRGPEVACSAEDVRGSFLRLMWTQKLVLGKWMFFSKSVERLQKCTRRTKSNDRDRTVSSKLRGSPGLRRLRRKEVRRSTRSLLRKKEPAGYKRHSRVGRVG